MEQNLHRFIENLCTTDHFFEISVHSFKIFEHNFKILNST